jgi:hypothetical protein
MIVTKYNVIGGLPSDVAVDTAATYSMCKWTATSIAEFEKERQHYLTQVEQPPLPPWESFAENEKVKYLAGQREKVIADEFSRLTVGGWALGKRPRLSYRAPIPGLLHLPRGMNGKEGFDRVKFEFVGFRGRMVH